MTVKLTMNLLFASCDITSIDYNV